MRFVVCFLGLLASSLTAIAGVGFMLADTVIAEILTEPDLAKLLQVTENSTTSLTNITYANVSLVVLVAAAYGFLGAFLVLFRCGKQGGALLIIPALGAALVDPMSLIFTSFAILVGFLALFIGPLPLNAPAAKDSDDEEQNEKPKAKPKPMPKPAAFEDDEEEEEEMPKPKPKAKAKPRKAANEDDE